MKVFISYSSIDRQYAFELFRFLKQNNCEVWLDFNDIKPSKILQQELSNNIGKANLICLLLSPYSVDSQWVKYEVEMAVKKNVRLLPVILRPCVIPEILNNIVGIDASSGILEESTKIRILRAVLGEEVVADRVLIDAGRRLEYEKKAIQNEADKHLPNVAEALRSIEKKAIHNINIYLDEESFPKDKKTILELQLKLNPLWSVPMSFYFAIFNEGYTWPDKFRFKEPSYKDYYKNFRKRIVSEFSWFDREQSLPQTIDGTDFKDLPASFNLKFDGKEFRPQSSGIHLPHSFQIPSLFDLRKDNCEFKLIRHCIDEKNAEYVDVFKTDIDLTVCAYFNDAEVSNITLFKSKHTTQELNILGCEYLKVIENEIEKEILLGLCPVNTSRQKDQSRKQNIAKQIEREEEISEEDKILAANYCFNKASFFSYRKQSSDAIKFYYRTIELLEKEILQSYPTYQVGVLAFKGAETIINYYIKNKRFEEAKDIMNAPYLISSRLSEIYPEEPDFLRLQAEAFLLLAIIYNGLNDKNEASMCLEESVDLWRCLNEEKESPERFNDFKNCIAQAVSYAQEWKILSLLPAKSWMNEIEIPIKIVDAIINEEEKQKNPVWLNPPRSETWDTRLHKSTMLRYSIQIPTAYSDNPEIFSTQKETMHMFFGKYRHAEALIVSFMDKAIPGHDMKLWVEGNMALTGFPIVELHREYKNYVPELQQWVYEGCFPDFAASLNLDEVHAYSGYAIMPSPPEQDLSALGARIYILLARKETLAWKITLTFTTSVFPGMPNHMIYSYDHVRAAAIFSSINLG